MPVLSISYDLRKEPGRVYQGLIAAIKTFAWCHPTESTWYVETSLDPKEMHHRLKPHLHTYDKVVISPVVKGSWWSQGLRQDVLDWLKAKL
jgi:hypothetical protein